MKNLEQLCKEYVAGRLARKEIVQTTANSFYAALDHLCNYLGPRRSPRSLTKIEIENWANLAGSGVSQGYYRLRITLVKEFFKWTELHDYTKGDPSAFVKAPKKPRRVPRGVAREAIVRMLGEAKNARERLIIELMLSEGLRSIEVSRLQYADVDFAAETIHVVGKGSHERVLPLTPQSVRAITQYIEEDRGRRAGSLIQSQHRCAWHEHDGLRAQSIIRIVSTAMRKSGTTETGHALRHQFAHDLIDNGAPVDVVKDALGHADMQSVHIYLARTSIPKLRRYMGIAQYDWTPREFLVEQGIAPKAPVVPVRRPNTFAASYREVDVA